MDTQEFLRHLEKTFSICLGIARKKNADYAEDGDPFKNFKMSEQVGVDPARALLVRMSDKLSRISGLIDRTAQVDDESLNDTLMDLINYAAILMAYKDSQKK
jgi:hypothetical protein